MTLEERVRQVSVYAGAEIVPLAIRAVEPDDGFLLQNGMIPFQNIYCSTDEDVLSFEPFAPGTHVSVYHTRSAQRGLEKPTFIAIPSLLEWLRTQPDGMVRFPIQEAFYYNVMKDRTMAIVRAGTIGLRPLHIGQQVVDGVDQDLYEMIPFIPRNYPVNDMPSTTYPYDTISVRVNIRPVTIVHVQRYALLREIYRLVRLNGPTEFLSIPLLGPDATTMRFEHLNSLPSDQNSLDHLANPRIEQFKIHAHRHTLVSTRPPIRRLIQYA